MTSSHTCDRRSVNFSAPKTFLIPPHTQTHTHTLYLVRVLVEQAGLAGVIGSVVIRNVGLRNNNNNNNNGCCWTIGSDLRNQSAGRTTHLFFFFFVVVSV